MTAKTIVWDDGGFRDAMTELVGRAQDLRPLMADIAETLVESTQRRFKTGIAPDGVPWPALKDGSGRTPLNKGGDMQRQIFPSHGADFAEVSASAKQASWHQFGTDPYVILPTRAPALFWNGAGHPVKKVNHPGLPARPFMGISASDAREILALAQAYLDATDPAG